MRIVVWGNGIVESRMLWERGESTLEAHHLAETLSIAWEDIEGLDRWAVEIECPQPDDVLRLVEETSGDDAVLGWSPAPKEIPAAWFMADDALPGQRLVVGLLPVRHLLEDGGVPRARGTVLVLEVAVHVDPLLEG